MEGCWCGWDSQAKLLGEDGEERYELFLWGHATNGGVRVRMRATKWAWAWKGGGAQCAGHRDRRSGAGEDTDAGKGRRMQIV